MRKASEKTEAEVQSSVELGQEAMAWAVASGAAHFIDQKLRDKAARRRRRRFVWGAGGVACAGLLIASYLVLGPRGTPTHAAVPATVTMTKPPVRMLPDGSVIELRNDAIIAVDFSAQVRRVRLTAGVAYFKVAKETSRPFVVAVDGIEVRAVGTAFSVQRGERDVEVFVTEGRVAVEKSIPPSDRSSPTLSTAAPIAMIDAGNRAVVSTRNLDRESEPIVAPVSKEEQTLALRWRVPRLEFSGTPLRQAVTLFNSNSNSRLVLDASLNELQMGGSLRADDVESLLVLLKNEFGIRAEKVSSGETILRR